MHFSSLMPATLLYHLLYVVSIILIIIEEQYKWWWSLLYQFWACFITEMKISFYFREILLDNMPKTIHLSFFNLLSVVLLIVFVATDCFFNSYSACLSTLRSQIFFYNFYSVPEIYLLRISIRHRITIILTHCHTQPAVRRAEPSMPLLLILALCQ
jgi:hypothetical protein